MFHVLIEEICNRGSSEKWAFEAFHIKCALAGIEVPCLALYPEGSRKANGLSEVENMPYVFVPRVIQPPKREDEGVLYAVQKVKKLGSPLVIELDGNIRQISRVFITSGNI